MSAWSEVYFFCLHDDEMGQSVHPNEHPLLCPRRRRATSLTTGMTIAAAMIAITAMSCQSILFLFLAQLAVKRRRSQCVGVLCKGQLQGAALRVSGASVSGAAF